MYELDKKFYSYVFGRTEFSKETAQLLGPERALERIRDGMMEATDDTVVTSTRMNVLELPAIQFMAKGTRYQRGTGKPFPFVSYVRIVILDNRAYTLTMNGVPEKISETEALSYLDSFVRADR